MSTKLAILELRHVLAALDRVLLNLAGSPAERDVERLIEFARDTLALVKKA
jgi:hypothetical protein